MKLISRSRNGRREYCQMLDPDEVSRMDSVPTGQITLEHFTNHDFVELISRPSPLVVFWDGRNYIVGEGRYRFRAWRTVGDDVILCDVRRGDLLDAVRYASMLRVSQVVSDMLKAVLIMRGAKKTKSWKADRMGASLGIKRELVELLLFVAKGVR